MPHSTNAPTADDTSGITRRQLIVAAAALPGLWALPAAAKDSPNGETPMTIDPDRTALLLLHYQTDILAIFEAAGVGAYVERMADLATRARAAGIPVFFVRIGFSPDYREIHPDNQNGQMIRSFGLFTTDAVPDTLRQDGDVVLTAHRVSAFKGTDLDMRLRAQGIDTLLMAGITTTGVVMSTLSEASDLDYRIVLIEDGCFEPDAAAHQALVSVPFATRAQITTAAAVAASL